jgi:hypothetical protein
MGRPPSSVIHAPNASAKPRDWERVRRSSSLSLPKVLERQVLGPLRRLACIHNVVFQPRTAKRTNMDLDRFLIQWAHLNGLTAEKDTEVAPSIRLGH